MIRAQKPRHRRQAGSGCAADTLIAWIGTDPYLREAATVAVLRRATVEPSPSHARISRAGRSRPVARWLARFSEDEHSPRRRGQRYQ